MEKSNMYYLDFKEEDLTDHQNWFLIFLVI